MKKFLLTLVVVVVSCVAMAANNMRSESVNGFFNIEGTYNTSAYPGNYLLLDSNDFPMKSDVVGVCLNVLPEGYHYQWLLMYGAEGVQIQVMPETRIAYISQNGKTNHTYIAQQCTLNLGLESTMGQLGTRANRLHNHLLQVHRCLLQSN